MLLTNLICINSKLFSLKPSRTQYEIKWFLHSNLAGRHLKQGWRPVILIIIIKYPTVSKCALKWVPIQKYYGATKIRLKICYRNPLLRGAVYERQC